MSRKRLEDMTTEERITRWVDNHTITCLYAVRNFRIGVSQRRLIRNIMREIAAHKIRKYNAGMRAGGQK